MDYAGFFIFVIGFAVVGLLSSRQAQKTEFDFLLASRTMSPFFTALSAAATKNSGYMFVGLIGYIYTYGLSAIWLMFGFLFGDLIAFSFVHGRVRRATAETGALTFADLLARWHGGNYRILRVAIALMTLVFLSTYAAAQFSAGGKVFQVLTGWDTAAGAVLGAGLVLAYCLAGGLRASIWTDVAQMVVMVVAMWLLIAIVMSAIGGPSQLIGQLEAISPSYFDFGTERFGGFWPMMLFGFGWLFNGIGVTGQPQVMVRFMALDGDTSTVRTGLYYFICTVLFLGATFLVGLTTRLFIEGGGGFDAETALPILAQTLSPGLTVGIIVGGVFAASISTADSQVLSCAAVLSEDLKWVRGRAARHLATTVTVVAITAIALFASADVFTLVIFSWSALACSIGPLVILHALGQRPSEWLALAMMAAGMATALGWRMAELDNITYEGLPGMAAAFAVWGVARLARVGGGR